MSRISRTVLALGVATGVMFLAANAMAETEVKHFDIPSEEAAKSIPEFARQAGIQITAPVSQLHGVKTPAILGDLDVRSALGRLLSGTGLVVASDDGNTLVLRRGEGAALAPAPAITEDVIVTGSRIHGATPPGSELIELGREQLIAQGYATLDDAIRTLPQQVNAGPNAFTATFGTAGGTQMAGTNHSGGTGVNLRGLGANSTLTLLDGQRMTSSGAASNFYDISTIPLAAVQRVEILADGDSAIYGSDSVGGVVNVILRKDFNGAETSVDYGAANGFSRYTVDQVVGVSWSGGHLIGAYEHLDQTDLLGASRSFVRSNLIPLGGTDQRSANYGEPGTISVGGKTYAIPAGQNGVGLSASSLVAGTSNAFDNYPFLDLTPSKTQDSLLLVGSQSVTPDVELFSHVLVSVRDTNQNLGPDRTVLTVPRSNAFWVSPSPTATSESVYYALGRELGLEQELTDENDYDLAFGGRIRLPFKWNAEVTGNYSREDLAYRLTGIPNSYYLNLALASSNPATAFNPFGDGSANSAAVNSAIAGFQHYGYHTVTDGVSGHFDGPIFSLPAGEVRVAIGGETREEQLHQTDVLYTSTKTAGPSPTGLISFSRQVNAGFAEVNVPVISPEQGLGWVRRVTVSAAVRGEDYSDEGSTINPRFGIDVDLPHDVSLRASYGTSFAAPLLIQKATSPINGLITTVADPLSPTGKSQVILRSGNDPNLKPETARSWSFGGVWKPSWLAGFKLEATYFNIDFTNRISSPANVTVMLQQANIYAPLIIRNPTAAQVNAIQLQPNFGSTPVAPSTIAAILDGRVENEAGQRMDGVDLTASYTHSAWGGQISAAFAATRIIDDEIALTKSAPEVQYVDDAFYPTAWKTRSSLGWTRNGVSITGFLNWQDGSKFVTTTGTQQMSAFTTVDLNLNVDFNQLGYRPLHNIKLTISAENVLDANPPFLNVAGGFDSVNASPLGRFVSLRLARTW